METGQKKRSKGLWRKPVSRNWWFSYVDPETKEQVFKSTGTPDKTIAKTIRDGMMGEVAKGKRGGIDESKYRTFDGMMEKYCKEVVKKQPSKDKDKGMIDNHLKPVFGG